MRRVTGYQGNTLLQAGKFKLQGRLVYIVKRTTMLPLGGGDEGMYRKDEETYDIPCEQWRALKPPGENHDSWWVRLYVSAVEETLASASRYHAITGHYFADCVVLYRTSSMDTLIGLIFMPNTKWITFWVFLHHW